MVINDSGIRWIRTLAESHSISPANACEWIIFYHEFVLGGSKSFSFIHSFSPTLSPFRYYLVFWNGFLFEYFGATVSKFCSKSSSAIKTLFPSKNFIRIARFYWEITIRLVAIFKWYSYFRISICLIIPCQYFEQLCKYLFVEKNVFEHLKRNWLQWCYFLLVLELIEKSKKKTVKKNIK